MPNNIPLIEAYLGHAITGYEIIAKWRDYDVILYEDSIYRFPRPSKIMDLVLEKKKLDAIKPYITLPIPEYTIVDNTFITYPAIKGSPFDDCHLPYDDAILKSLAGFLKELHSVPLEQLDFMQSPKEQTEEEKNEFYKRVQSLKQDVWKRLEDKVLSSTIQNIHTYMDELFFTFNAPKKAFVHADLQWKNIIYDRENNHIAGIIDFTDSTIWSIELDFCHFAFRDDNVLDKLLVYYMGKVDSDFVNRISFLAKRNIIWEITNDEVYHNSFPYLLEQLEKFGFVEK